VTADAVEIELLGALRLAGMPGRRLNSLPTLQTGS
jgi:hypothetical protein